jgi:glucosamine kinase
MIRYLAVVDGGGTRTRACVARPDGVVLACGEAGPSALGQGVEQAWAHVLLAIERAFRAAGVAAWEPRECALALGLAGAIVASRHEAFVRSVPRAFAHLALASDGYTLLLGAHDGQPGAVVAAGTGSIGEALRRDGTHVVIGGWGYPVGDEGSGAWLGMQAMREAQRALDGRAPAGALVRAVRETTGGNREALLAWGETAGQHAYASLAPHVFEAAASDPAAERLLSEAARALDGIAAALDPQATLPLVIAGSVGTRLVPRLSVATHARLVEPAGDAIDGALRLLALRIRDAAA